MSGHQPCDLGFVAEGPHCWRRTVRGQDVVFRQPLTLEELTPIEGLQREIFGASELDVLPANGLIVIPDTGGGVLAAEVNGELAGALWGFGGFVGGRPRIVSDWMGIRPAHRDLGLGTELKRLQAALAIAAGIELIVWTVDPLRAANARLNVAKLGATSRRYEVDRYGAYAAGLYGTMPTDRLHMEWDLRAAPVLERLRADEPAGRQSAPSADSTVEVDRVVVTIPADIDELIRADPETALSWRVRVRKQLQRAFTDGYVLDGFRRSLDGDDPALILTRKEM